jgi:N-acetylglucosaminyldiphosphoundecaprenol N-acetyl-beta-D-mannosaminyltransferase
VEIILNKISSQIFLNGRLPKKVVLYADFNVLNYLYTKNLSLNNDIILYPDSTATFLALRVINKTRLNKIVSTDLQYKILNEAIKNNKTLFFFGDTDAVLLKLKQKIWNMKRYKCCTYPGFNIQTNELISLINKKRPDILFVGLGVGRQEEWIINNYKHIEAGIIISVGGWFRFLASEKRRAPHFMRKNHMEWIYKLLTEFPRVWKRYLIGGPVFFYRVFTNRIKIIYNENIVV